MWLPDAHLCYLTLIAASPCVAVLLHGATTSSAISPQTHQHNPADAPPESRGTTRIRCTPTESCLHLQRERDSERRTTGTAEVINSADGRMESSTSGCGKTYGVSGQRDSDRLTTGTAEITNSADGRMDRKMAGRTCVHGCSLLVWQTDDVWQTDWWCH